MSLKDWFAKRKNIQAANRVVDVKIDDEVGKLWVKCFNCNANLPSKDLSANEMVCPICNYHFRINARTRINQLFDDNSFKELDESLKAGDPLNFTDTMPYKERQKKAKEKTNLNEAVITGIGTIEGWEVACAVMDFEYLGGSMGSVVGEKITRIIEEALDKKLPVIVVTSSGGARMQESVLSLMQMAKTSCAVARLNESKLLYMTILTEPTFGGVTASFGTLGDVIIAEKGARIGFAGRRVIEQTIRQKLPADFQTAEYLMKYGQVDTISERKDLKKTVAKLLKLHNVNKTKNTATK